MTERNQRAVTSPRRRSPDLRPSFIFHRYLVISHQPLVISHHSSAISHLLQPQSPRSPPRMAFLRKLRDEYREFPATMVLGTLWVVVFVVMVVDQARNRGGLTAFQLVLGPFDGHRFGDLTIRELYRG